MTLRLPGCAAAAGGAPTRTVAPCAAKWPFCGKPRWRVAREAGGAKLIRCSRAAQTMHTRKRVDLQTQSSAVLTFRAVVEGLTVTGSAVKISRRPRLGVAPRVARGTGHAPSVSCLRMTIRPLRVSLKTTATTAAHVHTKRAAAKLWAVTGGGSSLPAACVARSLSLRGVGVYTWVVSCMLGCRCWWVVLYAGGVTTGAARGRRRAVGCSLRRRRARSQELGLHGGREG